MGRLAAFTPEQVYEAAEQLFAAGQEVTPNALRDSLGKGSYSTFVKHIEEWKRTRQAPAVVVAFVMPDEVKAAFDKAWLAATSEAGKEIALIREKADAEVKAARRAETDAIAATVELEKEIEAESALVQAAEAALLKEREAHQQLASESAAKIASLTAKAEQMREQIDAQQNELQRLHIEEGRLHEQLAQAADKLDVVGSRERLKIEEGSCIMGGSIPGETVVLKDEHGFAGSEIVFLATGDGLGAGFACVVEVDAGAARDLGEGALDDQRGGFVYADPEQLWVGLDEQLHVFETIPLGEVLVNGHAGEKAQAALVAGCDDLLGAERVATGHVLALNGRARAATPDHAAAF